MAVMKRICDFYDAEEPLGDVAGGDGVDGNEVGGDGVIVPHVEEGVSVGGFSQIFEGPVGSGNEEVGGDDEEASGGGEEGVV